MQDGQRAHERDAKSEFDATALLVCPCKQWKPSIRWLKWRREFLVGSVKPPWRVTRVHQYVTNALKYLHAYSEKFQNRLLSRTCREGLKFPPMPIDSQPKFPHAENLDTCFALFFSVCIFLPPPPLPLILFFSLRVHPAFFWISNNQEVYTWYRVAMKQWHSRVRVIE